ncbi:hypothetical protein B0T22DRAFT_460905 [Podospora appendiculata]|uniref:FAD-binding PCMH-type domain-containing protein n=1 Tax=Podospora appendiculata TaxID=314037 RepID=A0AAE0XAY0_9PEZI|nr:hypothetical protein B0T22DRAFT_460905 [Podospora appendiculata]
MMMMAQSLRGLLLASVAGIVSAQQISSAKGLVPATSKNIAPAAAVVPLTATDAFPWETIQLTQSVLSNLTSLNLTDISDFAFDSSAATRRNVAQCKLLPGDANWPSDTAWSVLNLLTGNALIKTVPLAASCYAGPNYDAAKCAYVTSNWNIPSLHVNDSSSAMWPIFEGLTCVPPSLRNNATNCTLGGFASYSIKVTNVAQIQLALNFARNLNLRLVVRNTGHDFNDKSIGAGALSLWTHNLKDIKFYSNYVATGYTGPAFKLGAGVETQDVYKAADLNGVTAVGGECHTVGLAGGYTAGGGHSPMMVTWGMGADQVLALQVVLPSGQFVTASATSNPDLFWALRGGGGSTYGVVTSIIVKAHPKVTITTMSFTFGVGPTLSANTFWLGIRAFFKHFPTFADAGSYSYFFIVPGATGGSTFILSPLWANNHTLAQTQALVAPWLAELAALNISVTPVFTEYSSFLAAYDGTFGATEQAGVWNNHAGSRLFPRENFVNATKLNDTVAGVRYVMDAGGILVGYNIKPAANAGQDNAVNPAWRKTLSLFIVPALWDAQGSLQDAAAASAVLTNDWLAKWRALSPGAGSYMSEGDINEPDFQQSFYGSYYPRLYALKQQLDPHGLFYAPTAVGSEDWYITGQIPYLPTQNGRLCRKI